MGRIFLYASARGERAAADPHLRPGVRAEDGLYPMVTHAFNFVGRGALGLFQSGDGNPLN